MNLTTKSLSYSRDQGYFILEQGKSTLDSFEKMEKILSNLEYVTSISGGYDWVDFTYDKFFISFSDIKNIYKCSK